MESHPVLAVVAAVLLLAGAFTAVMVAGGMKQDASRSKESAAADVAGHPDDAT